MSEEMDLERVRKLKRDSRIYLIGLLEKCKCDLCKMHAERLWKKIKEEEK